MLGLLQDRVRIAMVGEQQIAQRLRHAQQQRGAGERRDAGQPERNRECGERPAHQAEQRPDQQRLLRQLGG